MANFLTLKMLKCFIDEGVACFPPRSVGSVGCGQRIMSFNTISCHYLGWGTKGLSLPGRWLCFSNGTTASESGAVMLVVIGGRSLDDMAAVRLNSAFSLLHTSVISVVAVTVPFLNSLLFPETCFYLRL